MKCSVILAKVKGFVFLSSIRENMSMLRQTWSEFELMYHVIYFGASSFTSMHFHLSQWGRVSKRIVSDSLLQSKKSI